MDKKKILLALIYIVLLSVVFHLVLKGVVISEVPRHVSPYLSLGFIIVVAHLCGLIARKSGFPSLTGFLAAGIIFGPQLLGFISPGDLSALKLINSLALSFIAVTAGGELRIAGIRKNFSAIASIVASHFFIIFPVMGGLFYLLIRFFGVVPGLSAAEVGVVSMLLGTVGVAKSPAETIAIINEFRARGPFTDVTLGVTLLKDVVVMILFALVMGVAGGILGSNPLSFGFLIEVGGHMLYSGAAGVLFGILMILFYRYVAREVGVFIIVAAYLAHEAAAMIGLEHMFMCMTAGFVVQNFSKQGHAMIESIENTHLPIYVVFFAIAGAGLNFAYFGSALAAIIIFIIVRMGLVYTATFIGAHISKASENVRRYAWTGFLTNAGLSLSMSIIFETAYPGPGSILKAIILSVIAVNLVIGPILFKYGLMKSGEASRL